MNNLFSVFDPVRSFSLPGNWISSFTVLILLQQSFWVRPSQPATAIKKLFSYLSTELRALLGRVSAPGLLLIPISLLIFILLNNFIGLIPFIFTSSRHLTFTVRLALPLWLGHILIGWIKETNHIFAHLVPLGTPVRLMPFIVLIETVRNLIRPLTLAVRLAANIVAGHLLLTLLGTQGCGTSLIILLTIIASLTLLLTLETAVAIIQAYVFSVLRTLYFSEVNSPKLS